MRRTKKSRLFGTDGIRGRVGDFPLDDESLFKLGRAMGERLKDCRILFGRDTRKSGEKIMERMAAGISNRAKVFDCGVLPTPGLSFMTGRSNFDYGVMVTASHNPYYDNGIKIFNGNGEKIAPEFEMDIENIFFSINNAVKDENSRVQPHIVKIRDKDRYRDFLIEEASHLKGEKGKAIIDCAHGAVHEIAPAVFQETGFETEIINAAPDGKNINRDSGSTNPKKLGEEVITRGADIAAAFDGDGDRVIFADQNGNILDGDHSLYIISRHLLETDQAFNKIVVGTIMGNLGLEKALSRMGITYIRTPVGDYNVYREMQRRDALIGGEQSGHTILRRLQRTGDGILTAIYFLKALAYFDLKPVDLFKQLPLFPQVTKNIDIRKKKDINTWDALKRMMEDFTGKHAGNSRIIIRYSGTEPKIRLMIESGEESIIHENIEKFENLIKSEIGG
jgi:phosphoglucosamine mutase